MTPLRQQRRPSDCSNCEYRSLRMFCNLSPHELKDLNTIGLQWSVPKGAVLFHQGDPSDNVAIVCNGQVKLSCSSPAGKTLILKIAGPGDVLGLGAAIGGTPYEVTAETIEQTLIKNVRKDDFVAFLERHGEASMHAAQSLAQEYRSAFNDAKRLALSPSAARRLASVLLDWGRSASCGKPEMRFTMSLTHEELANMAGTSRETVTRIISRLKKEKLIDVNGSSFTILAPEKLEHVS
jgi:cAMP-binding proteins - catabolite gene activator and regulatory subunit of cAMP-dependent protein kinases